jgi:hypothetical protein
MNNKLFKLIGAAACAAILSTATLAAAESTPGTGTTQTQRKASSHAYPFRGTVDSVDATAKTITLDGKKSERVLHVTDDTVLEKDGKPAKIDEIASGDYARGLLSKPDGGREILVKATFGPKPDKKADKKTTAKTKPAPTAPSTDTAAK